MHEASEDCLTKGLDVWEIVGQTFHDVVITDEMASAIGIYLDNVRPDMERASWFQVEYRVSSPVHKQFYGSADLAALVARKGRLLASSIGLDPEEYLLVVDLKGGEGIIVEPEENPQLKYYAFGVIDQFERSASITLLPTLKVKIRIVQPRAFHQAGPVREWETTVGEIKAWVRDVLVPAMDATSYDNTLDAGEWCRFCPAKLVCPLLTGLFKAAACANPAEIIGYSDEALGQNYRYRAAVKFYLKALEDETFRRLNIGIELTGVAKLVPKKANRVFKPDAPEKAKALFGDEAMTKPELKSPAEIEKISPAAREFVKEYAYMPATGLTVANWDDPKPGVKVESANEAFGSAVAALGFKEN